MVDQLLLVFLRDDDGSTALFRSHFSKFMSALGCVSYIILSVRGPIFMFLSILGHNVFICPLLGYENEVSCLV